MFLRLLGNRPLTVAWVSIVVMPYSGSWPVLFAQEGERLQAALAPWLVGSVEHIGSTAIPGLASKPILDMLAPVANLAALRRAVPVLADLGYWHADHRPNEALWFYKQQGEDYGTRTHQLHLTRSDSALWRERIAFRDALLRDRTLLAEYEALKHALAAGDGDLIDYTGGKRDFVAGVLRSEGLSPG